MDKPASYSLPDFALPASLIKPHILVIKKSLVENCPPPERGLSFARALSSLYVDVICGVWKRVFPRSNGIALIGLGSFGRREMNIFSDIDIQIVHDQSVGEELPEIRENVRVLVKLLWDIGVEIGHSLRSVDDCLHLAQKDLDIKTSFLEGLFIDGDENCFRGLTGRLRRDVFSMNPDDFVNQRLQLMAERHEKYGSSERILEPNVKDGVGSLRDVHAVIWLQQHSALDVDVGGESLTETVVNNLVRDRVVDDRQRRDFLEAVDFVLVVRNALHALHRRRMDVLDHDSQARVAELLGYVKGPRAEGVERFMRNYYSHATRIRRTCALLIGKILAARQSEGVREPLSDGFSLLRHRTSRVLTYEGDFCNDSRKEPALRLKMFRHAIENDADLDAGLEVAFCEDLDAVDDGFRKSPAAAHEFLELWRFEGSVGRILTWMHRLGFLERYLPEFGYVVAHYKYNVYHRYTTDEHLLVAVNKLEEIFFQEFTEDSGLHHLKMVYQELSLFEKYQLYWAVFLHDIGKGRLEDHSRAGVKLARAIFDRIGFPESKETVYGLIEHHLRMEQMAFRRNLKDPETIEEFARLIGDRRQLRMLYLLTYADMSAANTAVWTEWKGLLLKELFVKTDQFLRQRDEPGGLAAFDWESAMTQEVMGEAPLKVLFNDGATYTEVLVMTHDRPYRLSQICGAMAVNDVSILEANVHTRHDGLIADEFRVVSFPQNQSLDDTQKRILTQSLHEALIEERDLSGGIQRLKSRWKRIKASRLTETEILFDENRTYTIVDIFTTDRIGLLYLITKTLSDLRLNIYAAKIGTRLDGVADCFYILEADGGKLATLNRQREVRARLSAALDPVLA